MTLLTIIHSLYTCKDIKFVIQSKLFYKENPQSYLLFSYISGASHDWYVVSHPRPKYVYDNELLSEQKEALLEDVQLFIEGIYLS